MTIAQDNLLAVIRQNVDGMLVIDPDGVILLANPAAERLLGRDSAGDLRRNAVRRSARRWRRRPRST